MEWRAYGVFETGSSSSSRPTSTITIIIVADLPVLYGTLASSLWSEVQRRTPKISTVTFHILKKENVNHN